MKRFMSVLTTLGCIAMSTVAYCDSIKKESDVPKEVYYEFIKKVRPDISDREMKDIYRAIEYYVPRYFGVRGEFEESLTWILPAMAQESTFRNQNGDEGKSHGYMMVTKPTLKLAKKHNGIKRNLNLISRWDNIHAGLAVMNMLYVHPLINGDWELIIRGYNSGTRVLEEPIKHGRGMRMNEKHLNRIKKYRKMLLALIDNYYFNLTYET